MKIELKIKKRYRRHRRVKTKIFGKKEKPRLYVFRSQKHIYAQIIDDEKGKTMVSASDLEMKKVKEKAKEVGKLIAKKAKDLKIEKVIFDRGGYKYHGRVRALAEGAREGGLKF